MQDRDASADFLDTLPELQPDEPFQFSCGPENKCFNACCGDLNLILTPYDVLRLRRNLGLSGEDFINTHCVVEQYQDSGYPALYLKMNDDPNKSCPFVREEGCSVYPDRPGACRTYPLGRAARLDDEGNLQERFFLVQEPHCKGFEMNKTFTPPEWLQDQELERYNSYNDRYMRLMAEQRRQGRPIHHKMATMCVLALFQLDRFRDFIRDMRIFERVSLSPEEQEAIIQDDEACLNFGFDWVELAGYGKNERLKPTE